MIDGWAMAAALAKAISYAATLSAAGGVFFLGYCDSLIGASHRAPIRRLVANLLAASLLMSLAKILLLAGSMASDPSGMLDRRFITMILSAGEGRALGWRVTGLILIGVALWTRRGLLPLAMVGAVLAATSFAWVGHIHALKPNALPTVLLSIHLLCAAFWLGALPSLLIVARDSNAPQFAAAASRFGALALGVVVLLLAAGGVLLWQLLGALADLWTTDYGRLVALKLVAVALLLSLAALNKLSLTPRLLRGERTAIQRLRQSITAEMVLGVAILVVTAIFTTVTGPAD